MLWLTWRQHRFELLVSALLLGLLAIPLIISGVAMHSEYQSGGAAACVADPAGHAGCAQIVDQFVNRHREWANRLAWVAALPALAGVFIGAPLLAREFEHGTWKLAFTQTVTRTRWLVTKLAVVGTGVAVTAVAFALLFTWWRTPLDVIDGRLKTTAFIVAPPSLAAVTLFAFATGAFAGALLRRSVAAMGATLAVYLAVRIPVEEYLRPHYQTPLARVTDPIAPAADGWLPTTDWVVENGWVDQAGRLLTEGEEYALLQQFYGDTGTFHDSQLPIARFMADHGLRYYTEYHPNSSFASFQAIEVALFLGLAATLLTAAIWLTRRRTA